MFKMVSEKFTRKWYDIGKQYISNNSLNEAIKQAIDDGNEIDCWEKAAAFRAGYKNYDFEINNYKRYGKPNIGIDGYAERSVNHRDNEPEIGVSVITEEWINSLTGKISVIEYNNANTPIIEISGLKVGYGSDGEILILPVKKEDK